MRTTFEQDDLKARKIFLGVFYFCAFIMASVTFYAIYVSLGEYLQTGRGVAGNRRHPSPPPIRSRSAMVAR